MATEISSLLNIKENILKKPLSVVPEDPGSGVNEETVLTTDCVQIVSIIGLNS